MGCHQSKVEEQVQAPDAAPPAPVAEAPASSDLVIHSVSATDAAVEDKSEAAATAPAPVEEEAKPEEVKVEEAVAEAPKAEVTVEAAAVVEEATPVVEAAAAPAEEPAAAEAAPAEESAAAAKEEEAAVADTASTDAEASEAAAVVSEVETKDEAEAAAPVEPVAEETVAETAAAEPEAEATPAEEPAVEPSTVIAAAGVKVGERHVVFYEFKVTNKDDPAVDLTLSKRYNDFKELHAQMAKLMANEANVPADQRSKFKTYPALPALPKAGVTSILFGRRNKALTAEREAQFLTILQAIARHPIANQSAEFQAFLA